MHKHFLKKNDPAFTIVELLIVVVVIGILAAISTVAYGGISKRASQDVLQSDLRQAVNQLGVVQVDQGAYPLGDLFDPNTGLKHSDGTNLEYSSDGSWYCITASSNKAQSSYYFSSVGGSVLPGVCDGHFGYISGSPKTQIAKLVPADGLAGARFGYSVSVSANTAIIGAETDNGNTGSAYIYNNSGGVWSQQAKLLASDGAANDWFGQSVAIYGDVAVVGAEQDSNEKGSYAGSAYVFVRSGGVWSQQAKLVASDGTGSDHFGHSVAIYGSTVVVGAYSKNTNTGEAYVFTRSGATWSQQAVLAASGSGQFGVAVAIYNDTAIIGANTSGAGSAYIFTRSGTTWSQQAKLLASDGSSGDSFGGSVAIYNDTAVIGASSDGDKGTYSGSAYIFTRSGTTWSQQAKLLADNGAASDFFGGSVSVYGETAVIGAQAGDGAVANSGLAYTFTRSGTNWSQQARLAAADGAANDLFGKSVSVSGNIAIVGAYANSAKGSISGSAYFFGN